ncbi:MAG: hypothetical protein PUD60_06135 [Akkermansia muciniphila]|nr:hypothetical protein [Akkermansia muciniphila]
MQRFSESLLDAAHRVSGSSVADSAQVAVMLDLLHRRLREVVREELRGAVDEGGRGREYATSKQIAAIIGVSESRAKEYLRALVVEGKVRVIQPADYLGRRSHPRYCVEDCLAAWSVDGGDV